MRRIGSIPLVAAAVSLLGISPAQAQTSTPEYGLTAGLNISTISGGKQGTEKRNYRYDFMAGGSAIFPLNGMVAIQPEPCTAVKG